MKAQIVRFLNDLDAALAPIAGEERLDLYHIGRSSLVWKYGFSAATDDIDVLSPRGDTRLMAEALRRFGRGTAKAGEHGLYLEEVPRALPPVTDGCYKRATEVEERWKVIRLFHLEAHDLAVTKLKRFGLKDQEDIRQMCDLSLLDPDTLAERVDRAHAYALDKDGDPHRDAAIASLRVVQRYLRDGVWERT